MGRFVLLAHLFVFAALFADLLWEKHALNSSVRRLRGENTNLNDTVLQLTAELQAAKLHYASSRPENSPADSLLPAATAALAACKQAQDEAMKKLATCEARRVHDSQAAERRVADCKDETRQLERQLGAADARATECQHQLEASARSLTVAAAENYACREELAEVRASTDQVAPPTPDTCTAGIWQEGTAAGASGGTIAQMLGDWMGLPTPCWRPVVGVALIAVFLLACAGCKALCWRRGARKLEEIEDLKDLLRQYPDGWQ